MEDLNELKGQLGINVMYTGLRFDDCIFKGCSPAIQDAIREVIEKWKPYSNHGGKFRLALLFNSIVEPAWSLYKEALPANSIAESFCQSLLMTCPRGRKGFIYLERAIWSLCRSLEGELGISHEQWKTLIATLESLRALSMVCSGKTPIRTRYGDVTRRKSGCQEFCKFCGQPSELYDAYKINQITQASMAGLSGVFCANHKKNIGGKPNRQYLLAHRNHRRFEEVQRKLNEQTRYSISQSRKLNGPIASDFYSLVMAEIDPSPDDQLVEQEPGMVFVNPTMEKWEYWNIRYIRNAARHIVDAGITDKGMGIIALLLSGVSRTEVAKELGITRQSLWNKLHSKRFQSIPRAYRFDKKKG